MSLVELLLAMAVLSMILVFLAEITNQVQKVSGQVSKRVETLRETRAAFEAMSRRFGEATLNSYWGYDNPDQPSGWMRQSELHFATVHTAATLSTDAVPAAGHGCFFQAPFGYAGAEASRGGDPRLDHLDGLLNGWGYYVEFNSDMDGRTPFLRGETVIYPERKRFRLMELRIPSEELTVMKPPPYQPDGLPAISAEFTETGVNQWFADQDIRSRYARPIAENVVALVISPRIADGLSLEGNASIAPDYLYNSRRFQYEGSSPNAKLSRHQLPELLDLTLIATDEASWIAYQELTGEAAGDELLAVINSRFRTVSRYREDIDELTEWMLDKRLEPRIFRVSVPLRGAKFSTEFDQ